MVFRLDQMAAGAWVPGAAFRGGLGSRAGQFGTFLRANQSLWDGAGSVEGMSIVCPLADRAMIEVSSGRRKSICLYRPG